MHDDGTERGALDLMELTDAPGLTDGQQTMFHSDGFLLLRNALDDGDLDPVIAEYTAHVDRRANELLAEGKISDLHADAPFEKRLALINAQCSEIYPELDIYRLRGKASFDFLSNGNLIDLVESIVGPEITCSPIQHIRAKLPEGLTPGGSDPHVAPWHQDAGVTLEEADPHFILTVWLPMASATPENGCLQIIPRVHESGLWKHESVPGQGTLIAKGEMPEAEPLTLPMEKGDLLLMHKAIPHRSTPNRTDSVRWSMDLRYQKTGTDTGRPFYPDFVVRSRSNPDSVLSDHGEWARRWTEALAAEAENGRKHHRWDVVSQEP